MYFFAISSFTNDPRSPEFSKSPFNMTNLLASFPDKREVSLVKVCGEIKFDYQMRQSDLPRKFSIFFSVCKIKLPEG